MAKARKRKVPHKPKKQTSFSKNFKRYFSSGVEIAKLNNKTIKKIANDDNATLFGLLFVALAGVAVSIGMMNLGYSARFVIAYLMWSLFFVGVLWVFARVFGGKARFISHYRVQALGLVVYWIGVIPAIGPAILWIVELWYVIMSIIIVREVHKIKAWQATLTVLIPIAIILILLVFVLFVLITSANAVGMTSNEMINYLESLAG